MKITLESFLAVLKRSGLIAADRLKPLLEEFQQSGGSTADGKPFADWLVEKSLLTSWQAEKLLQATLDEEGAADKKLTEIAVTEINLAACA
mgnify:CR=1 FL=1